ncbi:MAG: aminotransferase class V-fold PLP-dependent enzyme [Treponema sp.]|jgi:cysteine desulfurase|nr:aminotransferase class V-fold PLP-dependent enzyme [Treponema sp.]
MPRHVYIDYNATTPIREEVKETLEAAYDLFGNASSMHASGRIARARIEEARASVGRLIGAPALSIMWTSGGSESNNTVFQTMRERANDQKNEIITTAIEHPCVLNSAKFLQSLGFTVHFLPVDSTGNIKWDIFESLLNEKTLCVSVMTANNEIGTIQDIKAVTRKAKEYGAFVHTDAVQAVGKIPVNVEELGVDYLTLSAHKLYGPKGVGALYVKKGAPLLPLVHGGHQEDGKRAGTYNNAGIIGFGKAAECAVHDIPYYGSTVLALRNKLRDGLSGAIPTIKINGHPTDVLPNTLNISFPGAEGESILLAMDLIGIEASTGSACASGSLDPSHVLLAIGSGAENAHGSIRFSLGKYTTHEDIEYIIESVPPIIARLRSMSTLTS